MLLKEKEAFKILAEVLMVLFKLLVGAAILSFVFVVFFFLGGIADDSPTGVGLFGIIIGLAGLPNVFFLATLALVCRVMSTILLERRKNRSSNEQNDEEELLSWQSKQSANDLDFRGKGSHRSKVLKKHMGNLYSVVLTVLAAALILYSANTTYKFLERILIGFNFLF